VKGSKSAKGSWKKSRTRSRGVNSKRRIGASMDRGLYLKVETTPGIKPCGAAVEKVYRGGGEGGVTDPFTTWGSGGGRGRGGEPSLRKGRENSGWGGRVLFAPPADGLFVVRLGATRFT